MKFLRNFLDFDKNNVSEKISKDAQEYISRKIKKLHDEGYEGDQAVAVAYSYARKAGYDVPKNEAENIQEKDASTGLGQWKPKIQKWLKDNQKKFNLAKVSDEKKKDFLTTEVMGKLHIPNDLEMLVRNFIGLIIGDVPGSEGGTESEDRYYSAAENWAEGQGNSAITIWGSEEQLISLGKMIVNKTHRIKSVAASMKPDDERAQERYTERINKLKKEGWKVFAEEENIDSYETILVKSIAAPTSAHGIAAQHQKRIERQNKKMPTQMRNVMNKESEEEFPEDPNMNPHDEEMEKHYAELSKQAKEVQEKYKDIIKNFHVKSGSEGPSHDPYGYEEYSFEMKGKKYVVHMGLAQYIKIDGQKIEAHGDDYDHPEKFIEKHIGIPHRDLDLLAYKEKEDYEPDPMGEPSDYESADPKRHIKEWDEFNSPIEEGANTVYTIEMENSGGYMSNRPSRFYYQTGTLQELIQAYSYTLEVGASWQHERGNSKINRNPKNIKSLVDNLNKATNNAAKDGYSGKTYRILPEGEPQKKYEPTPAVAATPVTSPAPTNEV